MSEMLDELDQQLLGEVGINGEPVTDTTTNMTSSKDSDITNTTMSDIITSKFTPINTDDTAAPAKGVEPDDDAQKVSSILSPSTYIPKRGASILPLFSSVPSMSLSAALTRSLTLTLLLLKAPDVDLKVITHCDLHQHLHDTTSNLLNADLHPNAFAST